VTYFGVLLWFIGPPTIVLSAFTLYEALRRHQAPPQFRTWSPWAVLLGHVVIALVYTTPWDNYLVANRVWWYEPSLVTGITIGWVPIEEYTFFVVQTWMAGLWVLTWMHHLPAPSEPFHRSTLARWIAAGVCGALWLIWLALLLSSWTRGLYMALLLAWFLPPITLQLAFGADILWHYRRIVLIGLFVPLVYLCVVDAVAIGSGTWTINPDNTVGLYLGVMPLEELIFFLLTSVLIASGMVLMLAQESHRRARTRIGKALVASASADPGTESRLDREHTV
jgi:lycopene cyclase domain-containing protein